jgi:hypothetical protein
MCRKKFKEECKFLALIFLQMNGYGKLSLVGFSKIVLK